ncbi:hypothetical protein [Actinacidiphila acidipaludis]|uniref:Lipopolysaccharide assembly protein A domain-containing protein n=1 Tax=Actinacidiphila acidipaludis TaxID=2873382 RepID=A0ABS7QFP9_9ACTN|nr:hypothetical protein [Streptomyces acidipaludis]MBY8881993.1 hypothetical protein [Streptomyces acidipaludis]
MLILGLLLLACTAAFVGLAIADNLGGGANHTVTMLGHQIAVMNGLAIFCAGLALALVFALGVMLASTGMKMRRRNGRKLHAARREAAATARERDELAARLDQIHAEHEAAQADTMVAGSEGYEQYERGDTGVAPGGSPDLAAERERTAAGATQDQPPRRRQHGLHLFGH